MVFDPTQPFEEITAAPDVGAIDLTRPKVLNEDGTFSTELTIGVEDERLNQGRITSIPTIWNGQKLSPDEAIERAVRSGQFFPSFDTHEEESAYAGARSRRIGDLRDESSRALGFDPSQPFEEVSPTGGVPLGELAPVPEIGADIPPVERRMMPTMKFGALTEQPEPELQHKRRLMEQYGLQRAPSDSKRAGKHTTMPMALQMTPGRPEDMRRVVKKLHGDNATLSFHKGFGDYVVTFKDTGEVVPFNDPGLGMESLKGALPTAFQIGSEVTGGLGGLVAGGPVGAFAGVAGGAGFSKYQLLQLGKDQGLHDMSKADMLGTAILDGAIAAGVELTLPVLGAFARRMVGSPTAKRIIGEITEDEMAAAVKKAKALSGKVKARTGEEFPMTAGQAAQLEAPEAGRRIRTAEEAFEGMLGPEGFQDIRAQQRTAETALRGQILGDVPETMEPAGALGEATQEAARARLVAQQEQIGQESLEQQAEAMARQVELTDVLPTLTSAEAMRTGLSEARDKTFKVLGKKYDDLWSQVPEDTVIDTASLRKVGQEWADRLDEDIFKSLIPEDRQIVRDALKAGLKERKGLEFGAEGLLKEVTKVEDVGASMAQASRALSILKSELRYLNTAPMKAKARDKKPLKDFVDELSRAREDALANLDPKLADQIKTADEVYAIAKQRIDESLINRMITKAPSGGWRIADDKVFDAFLRSPSETRNFVGLVNDPDYDGFVTTQALKDGIIGKYRDRVLDGGTTHKSFMNQYGASMDEVFSPVEMRRFSSLEKTKEMIAQAEKREAALIADLNRSFETRLTRYDAEEVFDKISGNASQIRRFKQLAPKKWDEFKALYSRNLLNEKIAAFDDVGEQTISANLLQKTIRKDRGALRAVYGDQAVNDLQLLAEISQLRSMPKNVRSKLSALAREEPELTAPMAMWRSLVARPLSRAGLLTTSAVKMSRKEARKSMRELLTNPEKLNQAMQLYRKSGNVEKVRNLLLSVGMVELERSIREEEDLKGN